MSIPNNQFFDPQLFSADDLQIIDAAQRREIMAAKALDSDLDHAYDIQLQEAITASLSLYERWTATTSSSSVTLPPPHNDDVSSFTDLQSDELIILDQEVEYRKICEADFRKVVDNFHRSMRDHGVATEIWRVSEEELKSWEDILERPFGEGSSRGASVSDDEMFRVYFKGLVEKQLEDGVVIGGIGVAICDSSDKLLFELRKPLVGNGVCRRSTEIQALIEGLNAALQLELKRVVFYCDFFPIFKIVSGHWSPRQKKISSLVNQVSCLREKFTYCQPSLVPRDAIKFVFKLASEAIVSYASKDAESSRLETCVICLEDTNISEIFSIDKCMHRYCFACMKQHVEVKLLHGLLPTCPHEDCKTELKTDSCSKFLTPRLIEMMSQRMMEASIPVMEKVYCPYPKCSALMSRKDVLEYSKGAFVGAERSGARKCIKCNSRFCIDCKVPWHNNMTCFDYKLSNPCPPLEEAKLKNLAATNLWRQCVKCNHMIELATGCYHMTCRCGYEFCYTCGAKWKKKKATCTCPLWDEQNILEDELDEDEEEDEDEDDEEEDEEAYYDD